MTPPFEECLECPATLFCATRMLISIGLCNWCGNTAVSSLGVYVRLRSTLSPVVSRQQADALRAVYGSGKSCALRHTEARKHFVHRFPDGVAACNGCKSAPAYSVCWFHSSRPSYPSFPLYSEES